MRRALTAVASAVALAGPLVAVAPVAGARAPEDAKADASADAVADTGAEGACVPGARLSSAPLPRRFADTTRVTKADLNAVRMPASHIFARQGFRHPPLPRRVTIDVYVHVIKGTHRGERVPAGPRSVRRVIRILNHGFHGRQWRKAERTRYNFRLRHIDYTKNDRWHHAYLFSKADRQMRRKLHRGGRRTLNLYINGGGPKGQPVLGWSRFPWQYRHTPRLDGVTVNWKALPGGTLRHYRKGDTVIHETGHWMGLFHTFQGGCSRRGDTVADTHAEARPSYRCNRHRDTCPDQRGRDPIHNFMDYSFDRCMQHFTRGQIDRMDRAFAKYRW